MKRFSLYTLAIFCLSLTLTSCELFEGVFKAGMGVGIFIVIAVIAVIIWIISRFSSK